MLFRSYRLQAFAWRLRPPALGEGGGDGRQTRSFMHVDECVEGIWRLMRSHYPEPLKLGTDRLPTVDELVDIVRRIAGKQLRKRYDPSKPQGVRGRNSDNTRLRQVLGWEPQVPLEEGLARTYRWIEGELRRAGRIAEEAAEGAVPAPALRGVPAAGP